MRVPSRQHAALRPGAQYTTLPPGAEGALTKSATVRRSSSWYRASPQSEVASRCLSRALMVPCVLPDRYVLVTDLVQDLATVRGIAHSR